MLADIAKFYQDGGVWMHPIAVMSVIGVALVIERAWALWFHLRLDADGLMGQVQKLVVSGQLELAIKLCNTRPRAALSRVVKAGLMHAERDGPEIASAIEECLREVVPQITRRTPIIGAVANLATLLGLLGTIVGLIQAFAAVAGAPPDQKSAMLTAAISVAMNTTAFGLIVAIPLMGAATLLQASSRRLLEELDQYAFKLQNLLGRPPEASRAGASMSPSA